MDQIEQEQLIRKNIDSLKKKRESLITEYNNLSQRFNKSKKYGISEQLYTLEKNLCKLDNGITDVTKRIERLGNEICDGHPILLSTGYFNPTRRELICLCFNCDAFILVPEEEVRNRTRRIINSRLNIDSLKDLYNKFREEYGNNYDIIYDQMKLGIPFLASEQKTIKRTNV